MNSSTPTTTRRQFLRLVALSSVGATLLTACSQAAPAAPTAAPKAAEPAKQAAPAAAAPAAAPASSAPASGGQKIVAGAFGAPWAEGLQAGVVPCFKAKTGGDVELSVAGSAGELIQKVMATRDKPALDVLIGTDLDILRMIELGILDKIDPARVPNYASILPFFKDPLDGYGFAFDGGGFGLAYNSDKVKNPPSSWVEFSERVVKGEFGRSVLWPHISSSPGQPTSWLLNRELGGTTTDPAPFMKRIKEMQPNVLKFYQSAAEPAAAFSRGEIDLAIVSDGRVFGMQDGGAKHIQYKVLAPGAPALSVGMVKAQNGSDAAWDYLNCAADAGNQAAWNKFFPGFYMSNKDVDYPPGSKERQDPSTVDKTFKNFVFPPWRELTSVWPQWTEAWTREIGA